MKDWLFAARITVHCLTGCVIGELIGLAIGVTYQLHPFTTMALATVLAFITGMDLAVMFVVKNRNTTYILAMKTVWLGELVSIAVMEIAMNATDYFVGGVSAGSVFDAIFWIGLILAIPAGYFAALPVNYWLVKKHLKQCH